MSRKITVGLEVEGFGTSDLYGLIDAGEITMDSSVDQVELISNAGALETVLSEVGELARCADGNIQYCYRRPTGLQFETHRDQWRDDVRYRAVKEALAMECPDTWQGVHQTTNQAAIHLNLGIDWMTKAGAAVVSVMNNIGPLVSAVLQEKHQIPCLDQLSFWQGWARPERLPAPNRWWDSGQAIETYYGRIPRLIRPGRTDEPEAVPDLSLHSGQMTAKFHLGTVWLLVRVKIAPNGTRYIEIRLLGSTDPRQSKFVDVITELHDFMLALHAACANGLEQSDAVDLFATLRSQQWGHLVPEQLLTRADWDKTSVWTSHPRINRAVAAE